MKIAERDQLVRDIARRVFEEMVKRAKVAPAYYRRK